MIVQQVGKCGCGKKSNDMLVCEIPLAKAGPEIHDPRPAPTGVPASSLQSSLKRYARRACKLGCPRQGDLIPGVDGKEVGDVPMSGIRIVNVFKPFLELTVFSDPGWNKAIALRCQFSRSSCPGQKSLPHDPAEQGERSACHRWPHAQLREEPSGTVPVFGGAVREQYPLCSLCNPEGFCGPFMMVGAPPENSRSA
jgi:hypothetical protein